VEKTTSEFWMGLSHILYPSFPGKFAQYLDGKDAFGALNSDSSRLIRLSFNRFS
jgi:hypothetical protein